MSGTTGAQARTLARLQKRREHFKIVRKTAVGIEVQWDRRNPWGGFDHVKAVVTETGIVDEK